MYKVGLIGFSIGGQVFHAPFIAGNPALQLYKVTARKEEQQALLAERYPDAIAVQSATEIFDDPAIDIVVVATSNDVHYDFAKAALLAGKHVVVEKPFTNTSAEGDELIAGFDKNTNTIYVDRRKAGNIDFEKSFARKALAPRISSSRQLSLKIFIDAASLELFADNGLTVQTNIFFPNAPLNQLSIEAKQPFTIEQLKISKISVTKE